MRLPLTLIASSVVLAACGGGGGGGDGPGPGPGPSTPATLTPENYFKVAQEALASHVYLLSSASFVMSPLPTGSSTVGCASRGTLDRKVSDNNNNGQVDGGDSITMEAKDCANEGVTLDGKEVISVKSGSLNSYPFSVAATVQYVNWATLSAGIPAIVGNGDIAVQVNAQNANDQTVELDAPSFSIEGTFKHVLEGYKASLVIPPEGGGKTLRSEFSGTLIGKTFGANPVHIKTDSPFVREGTPYPGSGTATITDAAGAKIRVRAIDSTSVEISLDADANGIYEATTTKPWSEVL